MFFASTLLPPTQSGRVMLILSMILGAFFANRFISTLKIMPGGIMTALRYLFSYSFLLIIVDMQYTSIRCKLE